MMHPIVSRDVFWWVLDCRFYNFAGPTAQDTMAGKVVRSLGFRIFRANFGEVVLLCNWRWCRTFVILWDRCGGKSLSKWDRSLMGGHFWGWGNSLCEGYRKFPVISWFGGSHFQNGAGHFWVTQNGGGHFWWWGNSLCEGYRKLPRHFMVGGKSLSKWGRSLMGEVTFEDGATQTARCTGSCPAPWGHGGVEWLPPKNGTKFRGTYYLRPPLINYDIVRLDDDILDKLKWRQWPVLSSATKNQQNHEHKNLIPQKIVQRPPSR